MGSELTDNKVPDISQLGVGFWFQWIIANAAGFAIGMALRQFLFGLGPWATNQFVIGAEVGTAIGLIQMFNLKQYVGRANWWWVLATTIGWAVGWGLGWRVGWIVIGGLGISEVSALMGGLAGALAGLMQWFLLKQQFRQAGWWLLINIVGWTAGMAVGMSIGRFFGFILVGAVGGAIIGFPLIWLLRNPIYKNAQGEA